MTEKETTEEILPFLHKDVDRFLEILRGCPDCKKEDKGERNSFLWVCKDHHHQNGIIAGYWLVSQKIQERLKLAEVIINMPRAEDKSDGKISRATAIDVYREVFLKEFKLTKEEERLFREMSK